MDKPALLETVSLVSQILVVVSALLELATKLAK